MKAYSISSPDVLRQVAQSVKWDRDFRRVMAFADTWERNVDQMAVTLELGKNAQLVANKVTGREVLGTLYTAAAKNYARELSEV